MTGHDGSASGAGPHSFLAPQSGLLFYTPSLIKCVMSHAGGQCYSKCFKNAALSAEDVTERGGNSSMIHVDWMIGSDEIDIDDCTGRHSDRSLSQR